MINMKNIVIKKAILHLLNDNENSSDSDINKSFRKRCNSDCDTESNGEQDVAPW